jgi:uridine kinase
MGTGAAASELTRQGCMKRAMLTHVLMAIRVLLDHGVPRKSHRRTACAPTNIAESHIIFLTFLISRRGLCSVRRAFPSVRIVTAAIDPGLHEMHLPLTSLVMGEAAGEADFAVRLVDDTQDAEEAQDQDGTLVRGQAYDQGYAEYTGLGDMRAQLDLTLAGKKGLVGEGFRVPVRKGTEELMFSRRHRRDTMPSSVKRAWVVSPGERGGSLSAGPLHTHTHTPPPSSLFTDDSCALDNGHPLTPRRDRYYTV